MINQDLNDKPGSGAEGGGRGVRGRAGWREGVGIKCVIRILSVLSSSCAVFCPSQSTQALFITPRNPIPRLSNNSIQFLLKMSILKPG